MSTLTTSISSVHSTSSSSFSLDHCIKKPQKRWRLAVNLIYSGRVFISVAKAIISRKIQINPSTSLSLTDHIALDIDNTHVEVFNLSHKDLIQIVKEKNLQDLDRFGGIEKVIEVLETNVENGVSDMGRRRQLYGSNTYRKPKPKGFIHFVMEAIKDTTILLLMACAALSIGFDIKENGVKGGWYTGGGIFIAVFLVVGISALSNLRQSRQFTKLSGTVSNNIQVEVLRDGRRQRISVFETVVGDVVFLKIGDQIPADGLFLHGHSVQVDESSMTGESDNLDVDGSKNPFLHSGCKVVDGYVSMVATSVGIDTAWGEMMSSASDDSSSEKTLLQERLDKLTSYIGKLGLTVAFLVLVVLLIRYFTGHTISKNGKVWKFNRSNTKMNDVINAMVRIISDAVTIVEVAIPEGLPLAVTLTLAYSVTRMMADQAMVRNLSACETMGSATTICTDKTGTLTLNQMKVTKFWLGQEEMKVGDASVVIAPAVHELLYQGVALNTTGSVYRPSSGAQPEFSGSPTEKAILSWAVLELGMNMEESKKSCNVLHVEGFNSEKKRSGVSMQKKNGKKTTSHVHWKGAAEMILDMCSSYYESNGDFRSIGESERKNLEKTIKHMAANSLRCIAFAYGEFPKEEIEYKDDDGNIQQKLKEDDLTLLGIVGIREPCRPGVKTAVEASRNAGVNVIMITGDNVFTAIAIAIECGIIGPYHDDLMYNGKVVEGVVFKNWEMEERMEKVDKIVVMARASPFDKLLMVECLKKKGHVVAVTGDGTNDAPALKEADIGIAMGIQGTEVAKESSDIVILDDNFASVVTVLKWGRCVYNNIQKFIQFQLTATIVALVLNCIMVVITGEVPLTAVQLLWVNLIMDTLGALALATDRPTEDLMNMPPVGRTAPLITNIMRRNILAQALYQIIVLLIIQFKGKAIFGVDDKVKDTMIFNTSVLCQVFNVFNARKLEKKNVFEGILKNRLFLGIVGITIVLQVVMVEFLKKFADTERLDWRQWGACIGISSLTLPIGWVVKCIPVSDKPLFYWIFSSLFWVLQSMGKT